MTAIRSPARTTTRRLGIDLIIAALSGGQTVTVRTGEGGANSERGVIALNAPLDIERTTGSNTLVLDAHGNVSIDENITDEAGGAELNLVLRARNDDVLVHADVMLFGGSLVTHGENDGDFVHIGDGATVTLDDVTWTIDNGGGLIVGPGYVGSLGTTGTLVARNGTTIDATGKLIVVGHLGVGDGAVRIETGSRVEARAIIIGDDDGSRGDVIVSGSDSVLTTAGRYNEVLVGLGGTGALSILHGADVTTRRVVAGGAAGSRGTVTVTGSGSSLTTVGDNNEVFVGNRGTGTIHVLDGGLVDTRKFHLAWWGRRQGSHPRRRRGWNAFARDRLAGQWN